ncbi:tetratricopeptide repeat protein [Singulisphaera sp. PoT]|uniref:tetratricopeptide repeat protein n=1 Tax=Singulisphaera sp. PoT TaxID=3411797 RepID=UPI003BF4AEC4
MELYQHLLRSRPNDAEIYNHLGIAFGKLGRGEDAIKSFETALHHAPKHLEARSNLGVLLVRLGRLPSAIAHFEEVLRLKPDFAEVHSNLGAVYRMVHEREKAAEHYRSAITLNPDFAAAHHNLANLLVELERLAEAEQSYRQALRIDPRSAEVWNGLGLVLASFERFGEAESAYLKALEVDPHNADAENNLGNTLMALDRFEDAFERFRRAIQKKPYLAEAHNNLAWPLMKFGRYEDAEICYENALQIDPNYAHAHFNRAICWLIQGKFAQGWPEYEWRWRCKTGSFPSHDQPVWDGQDITGKTILLHCEQGLGDTLQFIRYAPMLKERGATVVVECQPALVPILERCEGIDRLIAKGQGLPPFDMHSALLSLPSAFRTASETIPDRIPYLFADPELIQHWRARLTASEGFRVGIHWQGSNQYNGDRQRSIPLRHFETIADVPGVRLYSLQKNEGSAQLADFARKHQVIDLADELDAESGAFMDTAAVMINLDLMITSDTSLAHLAGGLGIPVWVPLSKASDWRWLADREDSPWYPTMRLFRQEALGDWQTVFRRMAKQLEMIRNRAARRDPVTVSISIGELVDKISILELKAERIPLEEKRRSVHAELASLRKTFGFAVESTGQIIALQAELKRVNARLWDVEEEIRQCDRDGDFGPRFVALAQSVYRQNDRRAMIKRQIDQRLGSPWVEVKSYA